MLAHYISWLFPWKNRLSVQLLLHKYLRLVAPACLLATFASSAFLLRYSFFQTVFLIQLLAYLLAIIGLAFKPRSRFFSIPAGFVFLNIMVIRGFVLYFSGKANASWAKPAFTKSTEIRAS